MRNLFRPVARSALMGAAIGFPILAVGGRILMRVIAHWEGRQPVLTFGGTLTVLFAGTMAGLAGGIIHGLLRRFVHHLVLRNAVFAIVCVLFTWRAVNLLLPRPRLMFVALTIVYVIALELATGRESTVEPIAQPT